MSERIRAFTLRKKTSKAGMIYFIAPFGDVDLLAFSDDETGNITAYYSPREQKPATAPYTQPQSRPKIIPRSNPVQIREPNRNAPHHRPQSQAPPHQAFIDYTAQRMMDVPQDEAPWPEEPEIPF